ncbi:MAG: hypothetical protein QMB62_08490, partial [Oscillospiraceae bacterium]
MEKTELFTEQKKLSPPNGMAVLIINTLIIIACIIGVIVCAERADTTGNGLYGALAAVCAILGFIVCP